MRNHALALVALTIALGAAAHAQSYTESILHTFTDANPTGTLSIDSAGNLYGALGAAVSGDKVVNNGTVFKLSPSGKETILHTFSGSADGEVPVAPFALDAAGNLYGVTSFGGPTSATFGGGAGVIFKITSKGKFSVLHKFAASGLQGAQPLGPLTIDAAGNLYGTTSQGGNLVACNTKGGAVGCGVVFKLTSKGVFSVLHAFDVADGAYPTGNLILDQLGNIYGAAQGGPSDSSGVLFELTPTGKETILFSSNTVDSYDTSYPTYIARDSDGNLFATGFTPTFDASAGGIYEVNTAGTESLLYGFCPDINGGGACPDGDRPTGEIVDAGGLLYGTTVNGGAGRGAEEGLVYQVSPSTGIETVLYTFPADLSQGCSPQGISADSQGNLYGTASYIECAGSNGGVVFKLTKAP